MKNIKKIPKHIGLIIDGNRRWAREKGLPTLEGHRQGLENFKRIVDYAFEKEIETITAYCFSTENWNRTRKEVKYLMVLLGKSIAKKNIKKYHQKGIKIKIIGQKEKLPQNLQKRIKEAEDSTKYNKKGLLNLAISYGGRTEIIEAIKKIIKKRIPSKDITEEVISQNLWTSNSESPDLIIRSGGEQRLSNFLTWQSVYSELYFTKKYWPDFKEKDLDKALKDYSKRQRRYGN